MTAILGRTAVTLGFAAALLGVLTIAAGLRRDSKDLLRAGRTYAWVILAAAIAAVVAMQIALIRHDFSLEYVASNGSRTTPLLFTITGMWYALELRAPGLHVAGVTIPGIPGVVLGHNERIAWASTNAVVSSSGKGSGTGTASRPLFATRAAASR